MAGTVETDLAFFSGASGGSSNTSCDTITDWSPTTTLDTEIFIQGTGSQSAKVSKSGGTTNRFWFSLTGTADVTDKMIYVWAYSLLPRLLATKANLGFGIRVESAAANWSEWTIAGNDTWSGAWKCFAVHTSQTPTSTGTNPATLSAINKVAVVWTVTGIAKVSPNVFWDGIRFGTELRIRGGTSASPATFQDFITAEDNVSNKYGILEEIEGILMCQGNLQFGSTTSGESTHFEDTSKVLVFKEGPNTFPAEYFQIEVLGNSGTFTTVIFGDEVDSSGVSGCNFRSSAVPKYKFFADDQYISTLGLYGCSFYDANTISLPGTFTSDHEVENTNFEAGNVLNVDICKVLTCNFISADNIAVEMPRAHNVTYCRFINNPVGIHVTETSTGTLPLSGDLFSGNVVDIQFDGAAGTTLYLENTNGSDPTLFSCPNGGTIIILPTPVDLDVYVDDEDGNALSGIRVAIFTDPGGTQLMNELTVDGLATESYQYTTSQTVTVRVRKQGYIPVFQSATIGAAGLLLYITLYEDTVYNPV